MQKFNVFEASTFRSVMYRANFYRTVGTKKTSNLLYKADKLQKIGFDIPLSSYLLDTHETNLL